MGRPDSEIAREINPGTWDRPSIEGSDKYTFTLLTLDKPPELADKIVLFAIATIGHHISILDRILETRINEGQALVFFRRSGTNDTRLFWYNNPITRVVLFTTNRQKPG